MSQQELEIHMRQLIDKLSTGTVFTLSDIIPDPPALLGRRLYEGVQSGNIGNVCCIGKSAGVETYKKL